MSDVRRACLYTALASALTLGACSQTAQLSAIDRLKLCTGDDAPTDAYCGTLKVF